MELIQWSDDYSVGIKQIDNQHKGLVILINELYSLITKGQSKGNLEKVFDHLFDYTKKHFSTEEIMLDRFMYPDLEQHKREHKHFVEKLNNLKNDFDNNKITISLEVLNFMKDWLVNHILISDKNYSSHMQKCDF